MGNYSIGELASIIKKSSDTIRLWEKKGKLKPTFVNSSKQRFYSERQVLDQIHETPELQEVELKLKVRTDLLKKIDLQFQGKDLSEKMGKIMESVINET